jgi:hypothetical protein
MRLVLVDGHAAIADFQHVGVVPGARLSVFLQAVLQVEKDCERTVVVEDVVGRAPAVCVLGGPGGRVLDAPFAH